MRAERFLHGRQQFFFLSTRLELLRQEGGEVTRGYGVQGTSFLRRRYCPDGIAI